MQYARVLIACIVSLACCSFSQAKDDPDRPQEGYDYTLTTAESTSGPGDEKQLNNSRGQIILLSDEKIKNFDGDIGLDTALWRGEADKKGDSFRIAVSPNAGKYRGENLAYNVRGKEPTVNLKDLHHQGTLWVMVPPVTEDWKKKYISKYRRGFHLQAVEGEYKGYFLTFGEPEVVKLDEKNSYVRRRALLTKNPDEMSVLYKNERRQR